MRLSDVLSKEPNLEFQQVDGFLKKKLPCGGQQRLDVGVVCRAFYCKNCGSDLTFSMGDRAKIACIGVTNYLVKQISDRDTLKNTIKFAQTSCC